MAIEYGEIMAGIFRERIRAFLKPFSQNADLLVGTKLGIGDLLNELSSHKAEFSERAYLDTYNALLLQKSKVERALIDAKAEKDALARRRMKTGEIEKQPWL